MGPLRHILAVYSPVHDDTAMIDYAVGLARDSNAALSILAVVEPPAEIAKLARILGVSEEDAGDRLLEEERKRIRHLLAPLRLSGEVEIDIRLGKPFIEIVRKAMAVKADLVIKTAEALSDVSRYLFKSTDQHLLRKCPSPVLLRRLDETPGIQRIIAAVDVNENMASEPDTLTGLNRRILAVAAAIAAPDKAPIHVLHAWEAPGEGLIKLWADPGDAERAAAAYEQEVSSDHMQALDALIEMARDDLSAAGHGTIRLKPLLIQGEARLAIKEQVEPFTPDILEMGTIARTGIPGFIIGNTAEDILNSVDCSVLTVKPPNYVSPLNLSDLS